MKRILSLVVLLLIVCISSCANADDVRSVDGYTYKLKGNGTVTIIGFDWNRNRGDIYIPSMLDGYTVTAIDQEAFAHGKMYGSDPVIVVLPNTITMIGEKAFFNSNVSSVNIPLSVQSIGKGAFAYCSISKFAVEPGHNYFATIDGVLYNKKNKTLMAYPSQIAQDVVIPEGIVKIDDYAFAGTQLGEYTYDPTAEGVVQFNEMFPLTITEIGDYAFAGSTIYYSTKVKSDSGVCILPASVSSVGNHAFENCVFKKGSYGESDPHSIVIGDGIMRFGDAAFINCRWYDGFSFELNITGSDHVDRVGNYAFASPFIGSDYDDVQINLPMRVLDIGSRAFERTYRINAKYWTDAMWLGDWAFYNTTVYSDISIGAYYQETPAILDIPGSIASIPEGAFASVVGNESNTIEEVIIHEGVTQIAERAFNGMGALKKVSLPDTLQEIGSEAFVNCGSLSELTIPDTVSSIGDNAFDRTKVILNVGEGSYPALWASENGYSYQYLQNEDTSWLTQN